MLHIATHTLVPKPPNSIPVKTKGERSVENPGSFCWWQDRDTVVQSMCCTQALIACTLWCCFYRQSKLTLILAYSSNPVAEKSLSNLGSLCLCQKSVKGRWIGQMILLEQELSTRLLPQPGNSVPVDHLRKVKLHFILQEHQVITQQCEPCVDRQHV